MYKLLKIVVLICVGLMVENTCLYAQTGQSNGELANQYFSTNDFDKAVIYYEKFYDQDPLNAYPNYLKCLISMKNYEKAEKVIKKQAKKFSSDPSIKVDLGNLYETQGDIEKAKKVYQEAIKNLSPDINQVNVLGTTFLQRQLYDYAADTYLQGRKILKGAYPFSFELAEVYAQQSKPTEMVNEYISVLEFSPTYLPNIQTILQNKIANDLNGNLSDIIRQALLRKIQKYPETTSYSEFLYWLFLQEKDYESAFIQAKSLDMRLSEKGERPISLGKLCVSNQEYSTGEKCFQYVVDKGKENSNYVNAKIELINAINLRITNSGTYSQADLSKLENDYETTLQELGKSLQTAPLIRGFAHLKAFYLHKPDDAIDLLLETLSFPNMSYQFIAECKLELADIYVFSGQVWDAALLYGQVDKDFKNDAMGREAKFRNARLSYFLGEFEWAKGQLSVLKAATSQLISNDALSLGLLITDNTNMDTTTDALLLYAHADLLSFQNKDSLAFLALDSLLKLYPNNSLIDEVWFKKAQILKKSGNFLLAVPYLQDIIDKYPEDILADDALFQMGNIYENNLNDKEKAKVLYEQLITKYPGSLFVVDARKRFRILRGDKVN